MLTLLLLGGCSGLNPDGTSEQPTPDDGLGILIPAEGAVQRIAPQAFQFSGHGEYHAPDGTRMSGRFVEGVLQGIGRISSEQQTYTGMLRDGVPHGHGELQHSDGTSYVGAFQSGSKHGQGTQTSSAGVYRGEWLDGLRHGAGEFSANNGFRYQGQWENDQRSGYGRASYTNGAAYDGQWAADVPQGFGVYSFASGATYEGDWLQGQRHGYGTLTTPANVIYEGMWQADQRHGYGKEWHPDGSHYSGHWHQDQRHGRGEEQYANGSRYAGQWRSGQITGPGTRTTRAGIAISGDWSGNSVSSGRLRLPAGAVYEGDLFGAEGARVAPELLRWLTIQAGQNDAHAQLFMGLAYLDFEDPQPAPQTAAVWLRKASNHGLQWAQYRLAVLLQTQDVSRMIDLLQQAADAGHPEANEQLATYYRTGQYLSQDLSLAVVHYQRAMEGGSISAVNNLAWILATTSDTSLAQPQRAAELIRPWVILTGNWQHLDTLAAAHARVGDMQLAARIQTQALESARDDSSTASIAALPDMQARLALYRAEVPYIE